MRGRPQDRGTKEMAKAEEEEEEKVKVEKEDEEKYEEEEGRRRKERWRDRRRSRRRGADGGIAQVMIRAIATLRYRIPFVSFTCRVTLHALCHGLRNVTVAG
jgi:hypothetical protein